MAEDAARPGLLQRFRCRFWTWRARRLFERGRHDDAAGWCEMALELDRRYAPARSLYGRIRDAALREGARRARGAPSLEDLLRAAAWCVDAGRAGEAGEHARRAARLFARTDPGGEPPPELRLARGQAWLLEGVFERALSELTAAARRAGPGGFVGVEATYYAGLALLALGRRGDALAAFLHVVRKYPWFPEERLHALLEPEEGDA